MLVIAMLLQAASPAPLELHLVCRGSGSQDKGTTALAQTRGPNGDSTWTTVNGSRGVDFTDDVRVDLAGDGGRVRIPQTMLPPIRGGKDGWFDLRKVSASADEITAVATINALNKAKLRIDRLTGTLSMTVLKGQFLGQCQAYDPAEVKRAF